MKWTREHLNDLIKKNRLQGYSWPEPQKELREPNGKIVAKHFPVKSEAKNWIAWNLLYWCNEHAVILQEEFRFHAERKWRFDWAIESLKVAIEFEGGLHDRNGSHTSFSKINNDIDKYNAAQQHGWVVLRFTAINYKTLIQALNKHKPKIHT